MTEETPGGPLAAAPATPRNLRAFGLGLAALLGLFGWLSWRKAGAAFPYLWGAGSLAAVLALAAPRALAPVYRPWMRLAAALGAVNTFLLMGAVFYLVITPSALLLRLLGKELLEERFRDGSYWKDKEPATEPAAYERQF